MNNLYERIRASDIARSLAMGFVLGGTWIGAVLCLVEGQSMWAWAPLLPVAAGVACMAYNCFHDTNKFTLFQLNEEGKYVYRCSGTEGVEAAYLLDLFRKAAEANVFTLDEIRDIMLDYLTGLNTFDETVKQIKLVKWDRPAVVDPENAPAWMRGITPKKEN